jgi:hypothetical protein
MTPNGQKQKNGAAASKSHLISTNNEAFLPDINGNLT